MEKLKRNIIIMMILLVCLTGCGINNDISDEGTDKQFYIEDYDISLSVPKEWREYDSESEYDLYLTNGESYLGVMTYYMIDLPKGYTIEGVYEIQNDDFLSRRENVEIVEPQKTISFEGKKITTTMFSGERDGGKNYYYSCLVTFDDNPDVFAWILISALPSRMLRQQEDMLNIIKTMEYMGEHETII